jgi:Winged helix DNA-binding domain
LTSQLLSGPPAATPEAVAERLLAVQAQDLRGARLAVRARSVGFTAADVDAALTVRRSLVVSWLNRGTLHLVRPADYWWLHPLTTPQLAAGSRRRLEQEGVSPAQALLGVQTVVEATAEGPQTRAQLRARLTQAGVPTAGQALVHVLLAATLPGHVVRGPVVDGEQAFVRTVDWLGPAPDPLERPAALARLARRYLAGHGPAGPADLAKWAGVTVGDARLGIGAVRDEVEPVGDGLVALLGREPAAAVPPPRLLGPFDPLLLGWASRHDVVGEHRHVVTTNGVFRPVALVGARVVATWGLAAGKLSVELLEPVAARTAASLRMDALAVLAYLETPLNDRPDRVTMGVSPRRT